MPFAGLGGSTVPVAVTERVTKMGMKVWRSYGSTEHPSITGCRLDEPEVKRTTTDGHALEGVEMRVDADGQILSRGPDCFMGYTDADLTASVFDDEGWYHTGDVGILDDDGYLTITDRISDVIIRGGENISAQEIEEVMLGLDAVAEVNVVGAPDERLGERAAAVIRVRDGMAAPTLDDVRRRFEEVGLARQKWPESLYVVDDFPRTASGKVQKFKLRQDLRDGRLARRGVGRRERGRRAADPTAAARPTGPRRCATRWPRCARPIRAIRCRRASRAGPRGSTCSARWPSTRRSRRRTTRSTATCCSRTDADDPPARAARAAGGGGPAVRLRVEAARRAGRATPASPPTRSTASPTRPTRPSGRRSSGRCSRPSTS